MAIVAGILTLIGGFTVAREGYERTIGLKNRLYEQLNMLSVNTQIDYFTEVLGAAQIKNVVGSSLDEYIYASKYFYVQAVANKDGKVIYYSVTTRRKDFNPVFQEEGAFDQGGSEKPRSFRLGVDRFSDIKSPPQGIAGFSGAHSFAYVEAFYFGNPAKYQWFFFIFNEAGEINESNLDPLVNVVSEEFKGTLKLGEFAAQ